MRDSKPSRREKPKFAAPTHETIELLVRASRSAMAFWLALSKYANWRTGECWPSYKFLMIEHGFSRDLISSGTKELEALGLLEHRRRYGQSNIYYLKGIAGIGDSSLVSRVQSSENQTPVVLKPDSSSLDCPTLTTSTNYPQHNPIAITEAQEGTTSSLSASLRSAALRDASRIASEEVVNGIASQATVTKVLSKLSELDAFLALDVTPGLRGTMVKAKIETFAASFADSRLAADGSGSESWYLACWRNWLGDMYRYESTEWGRWGQGGHLRTSENYEHESA